MKVHIIIFLSAICLCSCSYKNKQEKLIFNNHVKYWDVIAPRINDKSCVRGYCFHNNGSYQLFYYYKNKRYNDEPFDIVLDMKWKCLNDSFFILTKKAHILKLTKDSFVYQFKDKSIVRLVISKNQTDTVNSLDRTKVNVWDTIHFSR